MPTFGILHDFRQPAPHRVAGDRYYAECLEEVILADELGFDAVWLSEHHLTGDGMLPSPLVMAAAIAARTRRIRVGTSIVQLPLHHPIRIAEDAAVADLISSGRIVLGVGQGYAKDEFRLFGADRRQRGSLLEEGVQILRLAWSGQRFDFAGNHWTIDDAQVTPHPARPLPIYVGAVTEKALRRARRLADGILIYCGKISDLRARAAIMKPLDLGVPVIATGILHVAHSREQAWAEAAPGIAYLEGEIAKYADNGSPDSPATLDPRDYLVGTPDEVAQQLADLHHELNFDHFAHWARLPGISHTRSVETLHLTASELLPRIRHHLGQPEVQATSWMSRVRTAEP